jgi:hypothetical protein
VNVAFSRSVFVSCARLPGGTSSLNVQFFSGVLLIPAQLSGPSLSITNNGTPEVTVIGIPRTNTDEELRPNSMLAVCVHPCGTGGSGCARPGRIDRPLVNIVISVKITGCQE